VSSFDVTLPPGVNDGGWLTAVTDRTNVTKAEVSMPPFAVPPSSWSCTVTFADPLAPDAGVNVKVPVGPTAGCPPAVKSELLSFVAVKCTSCDASFGGPALMLDAQAADCGPAFSSTVTLPPALNVGASLTGSMVSVNVVGLEVSMPPPAVPPSRRVCS
jgi:hypothetical protein